MWIRRLTLGLVAVGLSAGLVAPGASAAPASAPEARSPGVTGVAYADPIWHFGGYYEDVRKCDERRRVKYAQGFPTRPTAGCHRDDYGYYFWWWE